MSSSGSRKPVLFTAFGLAFLILISGLTVSAQVTTGTIKGTVTDESGGVVAGASVVAKNEATGVTTDEFKTTGEGLYVITNLIPGKYEVSVTSTGFSKTTTTSIDVRLGQDTTINVTLKPGDITAVVTVTAGTEEIVNRDQSQISASFETRKIEELPFNVAGGGIDTLSLLAPGVINNPGAFTNTNGAGLSVNGQRGRSNNFQIDGSDNNDLSIGGPTFFFYNQDQV